MIPNHLEHCIPAISRMVTHEGVRDEQKGERLGTVAESQEAVRNAPKIAGDLLFVADDYEQKNDPDNSVSDGVGRDVQHLGLVLLLKLRSNFLQLLVKLGLVHARNVAHDLSILQAFLGLLQFHRQLLHLRFSELDVVRLCGQKRIDHGVQDAAAEIHRQQHSGSILHKFFPVWLRLGAHFHVSCAAACCAFLSVRHDDNIVICWLSAQRSGSAGVVLRLRKELPDCCPL
mmetsp:Transcript_89170/g.148788  ORF Transcript_89170/g.148788 Transcript_89170/m.148788 type:complete len:230 (+) Transcript_89170:1895-2584(+)